MKIINFSAIEILPALLARTKTQTIRPAWTFTKFTKKNIVNYSIEKPARFKVGDKIQIMWKQRGTPKDAMFCNKCGSNNVVNRVMDWFCQNCYNYTNIFPKILGTATITEVFQIEMGKDYVIWGFEGEEPLNEESLANRDGFNSAEEMFSFFDNNYNLSSPKKFWVYRWRWD